MNTAPTEQAALDAFADFRQVGAKYPAITRLWTNAWAEMVPFLGFDVEIRRIVCTTNAIVSMNAWFRRAVSARAISLAVCDGFAGVPSRSSRQRRDRLRRGVLASPVVDPRKHLVAAGRTTVELP